eukprot:396926-Rhodomonas_salina.1
MRRLEVAAAAETDARPGEEMRSRYSSESLPLIDAHSQRKDAKPRAKHTPTRNAREKDRKKRRGAW